VEGRINPGNALFYTLPHRVHQRLAGSGRGGIDLPLLGFHQRKRMITALPMVCRFLGMDTIVGGDATLITFAFYIERTFNGWIYVRSGGLTTDARRDCQLVNVAYSSALRLNVCNFRRQSVVRLIEQGKWLYQQRTVQSRDVVRPSKRVLV
jgi:hypothetical protein